MKTFFNRARSVVHSALVLAMLSVATLDVAQSADDGAAQAALISYDNAMLGQDSDAKRLAVRALGDPSLGNDDDVLPRLVSAVEDRQASDAAVQALRERTGLIPARWRGHSHYPGYPWSDDPQAWQTWLVERDHARAIDRHIDQLSASTEVH